MIKVLVVEDEADLRDTVVSFLAQIGMAVRGVADGAALIRELEADPPHVIVLDVNLPGETGFTLAARVRTLGNFGVIMTTARSDATDQIVGLSAGADSYLVKPVNLRVLEAAIRNLAGRVRQPFPQTTTHGGWRLDNSDWRLSAPDGRVVDLSVSEHRLLAAFCGAGESVVRRETLFAGLGKAGDIADGYALNALLNRLRRKVEASLGLSLPLRPVRAEGYVFAGGLTLSRELPTKDSQG